MEYIAVLNNYLEYRLNDNHTVNLPFQSTSMHVFRGTQRQFSENICSEDDLRSGIFGTFFVKFLACLPLLGFSNI